MAVPLRSPIHALRYSLEARRLAQASAGKAGDYLYGGLMQRGQNEQRGMDRDLRSELGFGALNLRGEEGDERARHNLVTEGQTDDRTMLTDKGMTQQARQEFQRRMVELQRMEQSGDLAGRGLDIREGRAAEEARRNQAGEGLLGRRIGAIEDRTAQSAEEAAQKRGHSAFMQETDAIRQMVAGASGRQQAANREGRAQDAFEYDKTQRSEMERTRRLMNEGRERTLDQPPKRSRAKILTEIAAAEKAIAEKVEPGTRQHDALTQLLEVLREELEGGPGLAGMMGGGAGGGGAAGGGGGAYDGYGGG